MKGTYVGGFTELQLMHQNLSTTTTVNTSTQLSLSSVSNTTENLLTSGFDAGNSNNKLSRNQSDDMSTVDNNNICSKKLDYS